MTGLDQHIYANSLAASHWSGWSEVPGGGETDVALAAHTAAIPNSGNDRLFLFHTGLDGKSYYTTLDLGTKQWDAHWTEVPGGGTTILAPAVTGAGDVLYLFAIDLGDNHQYMNRMNLDPKPGPVGSPFAAGEQLMQLQLQQRHATMRAAHGLSIFSARALSTVRFT
jgi:hypothetical protein